MNHIEKNMEKIVEVLIGNDKFITLEFLSQQVGISKRSVQNYMYKLESWLQEIGMSEVELLKKQGYGIKLLLNDEDREKLIRHLKVDRITIFEDVVSRRLEMLKALIFSNDELTIQFFADQFYISRTVILKDLEWISQWLSRYDLQLFKCQRRGIGIVGNEVSRRNAIASFFDIYKTNEKSLIKGINSSSRISEEKYLKLKSIYPRIDMSPVCAIVEDAEKKFDFFLTGEYFISLITHLVISISRLSTGKKVDKSFMPPDDEYGGLERKTSEYISSRLESEYNLKMPESERIYICIHLMSYNAFNYDNDALKYIPKKIEQLAISLIDSVDNQLGTAFATDKILFFGIIFHLKTSIYRLEDNISINAPTKDEFSKENKDIYNAVSKIRDLYKEICCVKVNDEEIIAISMHFVLSQRRNVKKKRALLVCNNGVIEGVKLYEFLSEAISDIKIVDICSSFQVTYKAENEYDFIISTLSLENITKPIANLSNISKNEYIRFLDEFLFSLL